MTPNRYRLARDGRTVVTGPLALVAAQASSLAAEGHVAVLSDPEGSSCAVYSAADGTVRAEWQRPLVLFPDRAEVGPPGWLTRLHDLLTEGDRNVDY